jgi:hypothetical protein
MPTVPHSGLLASSHARSQGLRQRKYLDNTLATSKRQHGGIPYQISLGSHR